MKGIFREVVVDTSVTEYGCVICGHILEYYEKPMTRSNDFNRLESGGYFLPQDATQEFIESVERNYREHLEQILNSMEQ